MQFGITTQVTPFGHKDVVMISGIGYIFLYDNLLFKMQSTFQGSHLNHLKIYYNYYLTSNAKDSLMVLLTSKIGKMNPSSISIIA